MVLLFIVLFGTIQYIFPNVIWPFIVRVRHCSSYCLLLLFIFLLLRLSKNWTFFREISENIFLGLKSELSAFLIPIVWFPENYSIAILLSRKVNVRNEIILKFFRVRKMFDIEDIGDSGDVRDDSTFKKGKVTNRKFQRKSTNQKLGILIHFAFKRKMETMASFVKSF